MSFANIVPLRYLPRGVEQVFVYSVPKNLEGALAIGRFVTVPFRKKNILGAVHTITNKPPLIKASLLAVRSVLPYPPLTEDQRYLLDCLECTYGASRTLAYKTVAPHLAINPPLISQKSKPKFKKPATSSEKCKQISKLRPQNYQEVILTGALYDPRHSIFLEYLRECCRNGGQVLCVLPDNESMDVVRLAYEKHFGSLVTAVWRSAEPLREQSRQWLLIQTGQIRIVLATRRGVFLPFQNLRAIVLFDSADDGYKSWDQQPYYDTRYLAAALARHKHIPFITTRAIPPLLTPPRTRVLTVVSRRKEPKPVIIDRRVEQQATAKSVIPEMVLETIAQSHHGEHCLVFVNRLGYAAMLCQDCGYIARCSKCRAPLAAAPKRNLQGGLPCHRCGEVGDSFTLCPHCQGTRLRYFGLGVERAAEELIKLFPTRRIQRLERATMREASVFKESLNAIRERRVDITVTTSIILSRLWSLPRSKLVAVLEAEGLFLAPDWRANERSLNILQELRLAAERHYYVATSLPDHPVIKTLCSGDLKNFMRQEALERQRFNYPPYARLVKLIPPETKRDKNTDASIHSIIDHDSDLRSINPAPFLQGRASTIIIKTPVNYPLSTLFRQIPSSWKIDVDPIALT